MDIFKISSIKGEAELNEIKELRSKYSVIEFEKHNEPPKWAGGGISVLHGLILIVGGLLLQNVFSDFYAFTKDKIFSMYNKFVKDNVNKAKVFNFVLTKGNNEIVLFFVFQFGLSFTEFNKRYEEIKKNYNKYFCEAKKTERKPVIFLWDNDKSKWEMQSSDLI